MRLVIKVIPSKQLSIRTGTDLLAIEYVGNQPGLIDDLYQYYKSSLSLAILAGLVQICGHYRSVATTALKYIHTTTFVQYNCIV